MRRPPHILGSRRTALLLALSPLVLTGCDGILSPEETLTLEVAEARVPCHGPFAMECFMVRAEGDQSFTLFYNHIEGFEFEPGFRYRLTVNRRQVPHPPADASAHAYRIERIESRTRSPHHDLLAQTRAAELLWLDRRPDPYRMSLRRGCFCSPEGVGPVVLTVAPEPQGGLWEDILSRTYLSDGSPVPATYEPFFQGVHGLFAAIRRAVATRAHIVDVEFDSMLGYPRRIYIDRDPGLADEEEEFVVETLAPA